MSPDLPIRFVPQLRDGYCLPACVQMALGVATTQRRLARLLKTNEAGTPFSRVGQRPALG
jgi:hypothetical protein